MKAGAFPVAAAAFSVPAAAFPVAATAGGGVMPTVSFMNDLNLETLAKM